MAYLCASERVLMSSNRELIRFIKRKVSQWHDGGGACGSRHTCICTAEPSVDIYGGKFIFKGVNRPILIIYKDSDDQVPKTR
jgi:hypothetical protein